MGMLVLYGRHYGHFCNTVMGPYIAIYCSDICLDKFITVKNGSEGVIIAHIRYFDVHLKVEVLHMNEQQKS